MKEIELFVHSTKDPEPTVLKIDATVSVEELVRKIRDAGLVDGPAEELRMFIEEESEPCERGHTLEHCGLKHRTHVHCHRCHRVRVEVNYNGTEMAEAFPPSTKVKRVMKWAVDAFGLKGVDAENKVLRLADAPQTELLSDQHIGSFVHSPGCDLKLCLVPRVRFQG